MIYDVKIPAKLFATLRTSIEKPQKMSGQWQWQVASYIRLPVAPLPSCPPFPHSLLQSHTLSVLLFSYAQAKHCCLLARTQASAGLDVFLNKCCG